MTCFARPFAAIVLMSALTIAAGASAQDVFAAADANGDGALDKAEFTTFIQAAAKAGRPQAQKVVANNFYGQAFSRIDKNKDGRISSNEISVMR